MGKKVNPLTPIDVLYVNNMSAIEWVQYNCLFLFYSWKYELNWNVLVGLYFQDNDIGQPPVTECSITLNDNRTDCQIRGTYIFPVRDGVNYTYNVTVRNVVGEVWEAGCKSIVKI